MKIQLDTDAKTIKIEESVNLNKLYEMLDKLLPRGAWKEYSLESVVITNWSNPIWVEPMRTPVNPFPQWNEPFIYDQGPATTITGTDVNLDITKGVYNIELVNQKS